MAKKKETSNETSVVSGKDFTAVLMEQFNKQFDDSPLATMDESDLAEVPGWISTGNYALNWIISKDIFKGLPMGRIVLLTGNAGSGKCCRINTKVKLQNQEENEASVFLQNYGNGTFSSNNILYDTIDFELNGKSFSIPKKCKILTKNRGYIVADKLTESDDIFYVKEFDS